MARKRISTAKTSLLAILISQTERLQIIASQRLLDTAEARLLKTCLDMLEADLDDVVEHLPNLSDADKKDLLILASSNKK